VATLDLRLEILEQARVAAVRLALVARQLEEVELVRDLQRAREVGEEDEARLERCNEDRVLALVVAGDLSGELADTRRELRCGEVDLTDPRVRRQLASVSLYRWARRSMSRL
jgi:hypothetical protein